MKKSTLIILTFEFVAFVLFIIGCSIIGTDGNQNTGAILMVIGIMIAIFLPIFIKSFGWQKRLSEIQTKQHQQNVCKRCGSSNINIQIISKNKNSGCLTILFYIVIACTIVGIPIMIIYLLLKGKKTTTEKQCICQNCGYNWKIR